jgi:7-cyano-7-deazaguanine synthase in queuosine biosynthesis
MAVSIPAITGTHDSSCICRVCSAQHYARQLVRADYLQQELSRAQDLVKQLRAEVAAEKYMRLTSEMGSAVLRGDQGAWERALREREEQS